MLKAEVQDKFLRSPEDLKRLRGEILRKQSSDRRIRVKVHLGTCGISAGAFEVWKRLHDEISARGLGDRVVLSKAGCIGMCSMEPNITVILPSGEAATYKEVTPDRAWSIVEEHLAGGQPVKDYLLNPDD
ncbi:MAG: (2Fe-2S) ferredoxin domain-containing protein, partial [Candidatus Bathyarchaeia archaeon]